MTAGISVKLTDTDLALPGTQPQVQAMRINPDGTITPEVGVASLPTLLALSGRVRTEELGQLGVARQLAAGAASANTALTSTCRRISIHARGGNIRFAIGSTAQTASGTSHYIAQGERLDLCVPATPNIGVIRADATDCTLEVTELSEPV